MGEYESHRPINETPFMTDLDDRCRLRPPVPEFPLDLSLIFIEIEAPQNGHAYQENGWNEKYRVSIV
jgi:hypothetical protein